ncbi:MAG: response regulator [Chitinophagaceae bacterium]
MTSILFAEDDPAVQDAFRIMFERAGYIVTILANGQSILENDFEVPDIFILDKQLSGVDGLDICRHLKAQERTRHIPVIMLSASPLISRLAPTAGADDYLEKPFKMNDLFALVSKLL